MILALRECNVVEQRPLPALVLSKERSDSWSPVWIGVKSVTGTATAIWLVRSIMMVAATTNGVANFIVGFFREIRSGTCFELLEDLLGY